MSMAGQLEVSHPRVCARSRRPRALPADGAESEEGSHEFARQEMALGLEALLAVVVLDAVAGDDGDLLQVVPVQCDLHRPGGYV